MAVLTEVPGLEVHVLVDGLPLPEHEPAPDDNDDTPTKITRYIVAEPGKFFQVAVHCTKAFKHGGPMWDISLNVFIDGKWAKGKYMERAKQEDVITISGVDVDHGNDQWGIREFMFSELVPDNSAPIPKTEAQKKDAKALGEIQLLLYQGKVGGATAGGEGTFGGVKKVHEKALKGRAISHVASLGSFKQQRKPNFASFERRHGSQRIGDFRFRYRSLRDLKSEMIIPRSPSPVPLEDRPRESLSRDELLELLRQQEENTKRLKNEHMRIKRERNESADGNINDDEDVLEMVNPPSKRPRLVESIDLTGD